MQLTSFVLLISCVLNPSFSLIPKPLQHVSRNVWYQLSREPQYEHSYSNCSALLDSQRRLTDRLKQRQLPINNEASLQSTSIIQTIRIELLNLCDDTVAVPWPHEHMHEQYTLIVSDQQVYIQASEIWGVLHAFETLGQLVREMDRKQLVIELQTIYDEPRYAHRGFLIDTGRHYLSVDNIRKFLDAMAMVKMNVLHWHIVDDQSFPFQSSEWPKLSEQGAYDPKFYIYTENTIKEILEYARHRGIRIMPEFDTPGHSQSWGKGYPQLLTQCYSDDKPNGALGPINPCTEYTYEFMLRLLLEVRKLFRDQLIHLGGDEVATGCWASNPDVRAFMEEHKFDNNYQLLQSYYFEQISDMLNMTAGLHKPFTPVVWEEVFDRGYHGSNETIFQVWMSGNWKDRMKQITQSGYRVLLSSCWYLDLISYGVDWHKYYQCNPDDFNGTPSERALVLGGEAALWGEYVDDTNLFSRAWPRGVPVAERLWSVVDVNVSEFAKRLDTVRCQMINRGWDAEPANGPGFCPI